jgi:hypothetical protein
MTLTLPDVQKYLRFSNKINPQDRLAYQLLADQKRPGPRETMYFDPGMNLPYYGEALPWADTHFTYVGSNFGPNPSIPSCSKCLKDISEHADPESNTTEKCNLPICASIHGGASLTIQTIFLGLYPSHDCVRATILIGFWGARRAKQFLWT